MPNMGSTPFDYFTYPNTVYGGASFEIAWGTTSANIDHNAYKSCQLLRRLDNNEVQLVYRASQPRPPYTYKFSDNIPKGTASKVRYYVRDDSGDFLYDGHVATVINNSAPLAPTSMALPATIRGGVQYSISWAGASDPDGNLSGYELERSLNGGAYAQIYRGTANNALNTISLGAAASASFRVRAYDANGAYSGYYTSGTIAVINNTAPLAPTSMILPGTIRGGVQHSISWAGASDSDGNLAGYQLERSLNGGAYALVYQGAAANALDTIPFGAAASVVYRVRSYDAYGEYSGYYTAGTKTIINNRAPSAPLSITVPLTPQGGEQLLVSWSAASDSDNNLSGYRLERSVNGAAFAGVYSGAALSYRDTITKGWLKVAYRVKAVDTVGDESGYTTSPTRTVENNTPPVITCALSGSLGTVSEGFSVPYSVSDADGDAVTVTEAVGGLVKRTFSAARNVEHTFDVSGEYFMQILNGPQTLTITAADARGKSAAHSLTFTKAVHALRITLAEPFDADDLVTKTVMSILGGIPVDAEYQVLVTNNAYDEEPIWEDMTVAVKTGRNYIFTNEQAANANGFNFIVTARRGGNVGGYISQIGGAFE